MIYLKDFVIFITVNCIRIFRRSCQYIRLTPYKSGRVIYFDKKSKERVSFLSRGYDDSVTLDSIFLHDGYNIKNLKRFSYLEKMYHESLQSRNPLSIIDCGANIGGASIYFAREFPNAKIISIEPDPESYKILRKNCSGYNQITTLEAAVGSIDCYGTIDNTVHAPNGKRVLVSSSTTDLKILSIKTIMEKHKIIGPFIVKIDIEGFERELFETNVEWIDQTDVIIIEPHDWLLPCEQPFQNFLKIISSKRRDFIIHKENIISVLIK